MPRRPIAKKPARKKPSVAARERRAYDRGHGKGVRLKQHHLESKITDLALHITLQERTIAALLDLLRKPHDEAEIRKVQQEIVALHTRIRTVE
jgi:hypothetical protein